MASGSAERFGYQWARYREIAPVHEEQFRRWMPFVPIEAWPGVRFLDVGCGMGRNSVWPMRYGAAGGTAVDLDEASLAAARRNLAAYPEVEVRRASAYEVGDREPDAYDVVFSIGVVHHLEEPDLAVAQMARAARPGGRVCIWVYGRENNEWLLRSFDPLRRHLLSRLPMPLLDLLALPPTVALWVGLRAGLGRLEYHELLRRVPARQLRAIVLDQMLPRIACYWTEAEVRGLMERAGLREVQLAHVNEMSWAATGTR